jgi:hypothetical protein
MSFFEIFFLTATFTIPGRLTTATGVGAGGGVSLNLKPNRSDAKMRSKRNDKLN